MSNIVQLSQSSLNDMFSKLGRMEQRTENLIRFAEQNAVAVGHVGSTVGNLDRYVQQIAGELGQLQTDFGEYVARDARAKSLQLAETRIVKVRQQLEHEFGYHDKVRRVATGVLQAVDAGIVTHEAIQSATESLMLSTPGYWLAPALVAVAAWIRDDKVVAGRGLEEARRRDSQKTALFMTLLHRRMHMPMAQEAWITEYFQTASPDALDREFVVVLDAVANDVFGANVRSTAINHVQAWMKKAKGAANFGTVQSGRWMNLMMARIRPDAVRDYPILAKRCPEHGCMATALAVRWACGELFEEFDQVFNGPIDVPPTMVAAVDGLLGKLVSRFDAPELDLRRQERRLSLILELEGDEAGAQRRFATEAEALEETSDVAQIITNAAAFSESSDASPATRRFAATLCLPWIRSSATGMVQSSQASAPEQLTLLLDGWRGTTVRGENEAELHDDIAAKMQRRGETEAAEIKLPDTTRYIAIGLAVVGLLMLPTEARMLGWLILAGAAFVGYQWWSADGNAKLRQAAARQSAEANGIAISEQLRKCMAEIRQYWHTFDAAKGDVEDLLGLLGSIAAVDGAEAGPRMLGRSVSGIGETSVHDSGDGTSDNRSGKLASAFPQWYLGPKGAQEPAVLRAAFRKA